MAATGAIAAGIAAAASAVNIGAQAKLNHRQYKRQLKMMDYQAKLNRAQYAWQQENYLSPAAQREAYERAGINYAEVARNGQSLISAGQLGQTGLGQAPQQHVDTRGLESAAGILADSKVKQADAELKTQQAKTESTKQLVNESTAHLQDVTKDNVRAQTAFQNIQNFIAENTKYEDIARKGYETDAARMQLDVLTANIEILHEELENWRFQNEYMNPAELAKVEAEYAATVTLSFLRIAQTKVENQKERLTQAQVALIVEETKNAIEQRELIKAETALNSERALSEHEEYLRKKAYNENDGGMHEADLVKWRAADTRRTFKWRGVRSATQSIKDITSAASDVVGSALDIYTGGVTKALRDAQKEFYQAQAKRQGQTMRQRTIVDSKGRPMGGFYDEIF